MMRFLRSAFVIARRDFSATVLSKTFIFFLLAPLFPPLFGGVFGSIGARVANRTERPVVAVVSRMRRLQRLPDARDEMADALGEGRGRQDRRLSPQAGSRRAGEAAACDQSIRRFARF